MAVKKACLLLISIWLFVGLFSFVVYAEPTIDPDSDINSNIISNEDGTITEYCESIKSIRTGGAFSVANQGYRVSLLETDIWGNAQVQCILDIVKSDYDPTEDCEPYPYNCTASYGFKNNKRYDVDNNLLLEKIFVNESIDIGETLTIRPFFFNGNVDIICNEIDNIQGQCKLFYIDNDNYAKGLYDNNWGPPSMIDSIYRCNDKYVITKEMLSTNYGYTIKNDDDFWFYSEHSEVGKTYKTADFYGRKEVASYRFLSSLMRAFNDKWSGFDVDKAVTYSFVFEPIIWVYDVGPDEDQLEDTINKKYDIKFSFYGTLTELAYIQMSNNVSYLGWMDRIGFISVDANNNNVFSGTWLAEMEVCSFVDGGAMMLRNNTTIEGTGLSLAKSKDFLDKYGKYGMTEISSEPSAFYDSYCHGDYVVNNMAVAILKYHPPITYTAQDYEYRTNTDVVTSIKLTNNGNDDFLPTYGDVRNYETAPAGYASEPVAIGAVLSYSDESGAALSDAKIAELGLPEFVSVQGIGSSQNFDSQRTNGFGFDTTPSNETYLYFKWKTPAEPMKLQITARFVGDNSNSPIYIDNAAGSIIGDNLEYTGADTSYLRAHSIYTTVTFVCDVADTMKELGENNLPPDSIGGFMDKPSADASQAEYDNYQKNKEVFDNYDGSKTFDMKEYLADPDNEPEKIERRNWFEYTAYIDPADDMVKLQLHEFRANSWLQPLNYTSPWVPTAFDPIKILDNVPYENVLYGGEYYRTIPSGYGFSFCYAEDYRGNAGIPIPSGYSLTEFIEHMKNSCSMFQNGVVLFPEFNYSSDYVQTVETSYEIDADPSTFDVIHAVSKNPNSLNSGAEISTFTTDSFDLSDRVHFVPVWYPDNTAYTIEVIMFDYWTPVGQLYDHESYTFYVNGNIYDYWYPTKSDANQKK